MDDTRRAALKAELEAALDQRAELDVVIKYLRDRLGLPDDADTARVEVPAESAPQGLEPEAAVTPGEFFGMSGPAAARMLLERFGRTRPLKTEQIFSAIKKGGVKIQSSQGLYRSLFRDPRFTRVSKSTWGLAEWYPDPPRKRGSEQQPVRTVDEVIEVDRPRLAISSGAESDEWTEEPAEQGNE